MSPNDVLEVNFLNRGAHDFVLTKGMQDMLAANLKPDFEPRMSLCRAFFAECIATYDRMCARRNGDILEDLNFYTGKLDDERKDIGFMYYMSDVISKRSPPLDLIPIKLPSQYWYLDFVAHRRLYLYVIHALESGPSMPISIKNSLLGFTLASQETMY